MSGGSKTSTSVTKNELPKWVTAAGQANWNKALEIDKAPLQQYEGERVAPLSQTAQNAFSYFKNNQNAGADAIAGANNIFQQLGSGELSIANTDLDQYMNPYIDNVETKALDALDRSRIQSLMGNADKARAASAFGGSRSAIVDAVTNAESAREAGLLSANLRSDAFKSAMSSAESDLARRASGASGMLGAGQADLDRVQSVFNTMSGIGAVEQGQRQREIDADIAKFNEVRDKEFNDLQMRLSALGMTPYPSTQTQTQTVPTQGPDWASAGLGALSLFMGLSDDSTKEDKQKLGVDPETGLDIYAYRYKGDPKSYPKVVGPMASDIKKKMPKALGPKIGGKQTVNYSVFARG